jgi:hypothetical protein
MFLAEAEAEEKAEEQALAFEQQTCSVGARF